MYRLYLLLALLGAAGMLDSTPVFDESERLNLSASCPEASCRMWGLRSDYQQPLRYVNTPVGHLQELLLENCQMRTLPYELLRLTPNLLSLLVQNCSTYHLSKEHFEKLPQLRQLRLQQNKIRLNLRQFEALQQLQVLQLDNNNIPLVSGQAFEGLGQLQLLGLQGNGITDIRSGAFAPLPNLILLDLSYNEIDHIDGKTFERNVHLQTLLLKGNPLAAFEPSSLLVLSQLRLLDLSNCRLHELEQLHLLGAQKLRLEGSGVRRLIIERGVISLLAGNNALTELSIGDKSTVIELDLHGNQLSGNVTSALVQGMWNLQNLDLSKNNIEALIGVGNSSALQLPSLEQLNLAHNQLRNLPPNVALWPMQLLQLDISFNHMLAVKAENFAALPRLQRLHLEGNRLQEFDHEVFHRQHPHLQELSLCDPELSFAQMRRMLLYLSDRGIHLPLRCLHRPDPVEDHNDAIIDDHELAQAQTQAGVSGIHPYWTTRDILAFLTLLAVFVILLMQLYRILDEEGCLRRMRLWLLGRRPAVANGSRVRRLDEAQDSQSSSD